MNIPRSRLGTDIDLPSLIFGSSALGNLYRDIGMDTKRNIVAAWLNAYQPPVCIDSAGKYGAGLALETIGKILAELEIEPGEVIISNKLGWKRVPLKTPEPTFEPGAWYGLEHDAEQSIGYSGIIECWEQGETLLGSGYWSSLSSVHDPDEYLMGANDNHSEERRFEDIRDAYRALGELKSDGKTRSIGVGSKDWRIIRRLVESIELDWVMLACSLTIHIHEPELLAFVDELSRGGVALINSAVFNSGFLTGGEFYNYRKVDSIADRELILWRDRFFELCRRFEVNPAAACVEFGLSPPGVEAIAMNTSKPERVAENVMAVTSHAPSDFWNACKADGVMDSEYPYL